MRIDLLLDMSGFVIDLFYFEIDFAEILCQLIFLR